MQNDRQMCKIKDRKFPFNILWRFGVMEETLRPPGMDRVKDNIMKLS